VKSLREQIAERATDWALMYPLANWPGMGVAAAADRGQLDGIARRLAARYGADIADAVMTVVQPMLDARDAEIARLTDQAWRTTTCLNAAKAMIGVYKRHITRQRQRADSAEAKLDAVIREVTEICDSFKAADKDAPEYLYSLGRLEMADWVRAAIPRALATLEQPDPRST
jgi:hypothetical protein